MNLSPSVLSEVEAAFKEYGDAVLASDLSADSQGTYLVHAASFIRWLKGEFNPVKSVPTQDQERPTRARIQS